MHHRICASPRLVTSSWLISTGPAAAQQWYSCTRNALASTGPAGARIGPSFPRRSKVGRLDANESKSITEVGERAVGYWGRRGRPTSGVAAHRLGSREDWLHAGDAAQVDTAAAPLAALTDHRGQEHQGCWSARCTGCDERDSAQGLSFFRAGRARTADPRDGGVHRPAQGRVARPPVHLRSLPAARS